MTVLPSAPVLGDRCARVACELEEFGGQIWRAAGAVTEVLHVFGPTHKKNRVGVASALQHLVDNPRPPEVVMAAVANDAHADGRHLVEPSTLGGVGKPQDAVERPGATPCERALERPQHFKSHAPSNE